MGGPFVSEEILEALTAGETHQFTQRGDDILQPTRRDALVGVLALSVVALELIIEGIAFGPTREQLEQFASRSWACSSQAFSRDRGVSRLLGITARHFLQDFDSEQTTGKKTYDRDAEFPAGNTSGLIGSNVFNRLGVVAWLHKGCLPSYLSFACH